MPIHLCAEHLIHIQTLSIQASLSTVSNEETRATLSADGAILTLAHQGEEASVRLPISISPNQRSNVTMVLPAARPTREVSFRVQLEQKPSVAFGPLSRPALATNSTTGDGNIVPWTATDLTDETEISCRGCSSVLVSRNSVRTWKDLPSDGWAEMMEYWHCHKPVDHGDHETAHAGSKKGYAANSRLAVQRSVGLVGIADFLLCPEDCTNIAISDGASSNTNTSSTAGKAVTCKSCSIVLGQTDPSSDDGFKLRKHRLAISLSPPDTSTAFEPSKWLSSQLLAASETQGVRKFIIYPSSTSSQPLTVQSETTNGGGKSNLSDGHASSQQSKPTVLKVWLFTPDLTISTSAVKPPDPVRVAKVLWREMSSTPASASPASESSSSQSSRQSTSKPEEINLPIRSGNINHDKSSTNGTSSSNDHSRSTDQQQQRKEELKPNRPILDPSPPETVDDRLNAQTLSQGELELSADEMAILKAELEATALWLPEKARVFGGGGGGINAARAPEEWRVGLLRRFIEADLRHDDPAPAAAGEDDGRRCESTAVKSEKEVSDMWKPLYT